jgi:hypothetical protein
MVNKFYSKKVPLIKLKPRNRALIYKKILIKGFLKNFYEKNYLKIEQTLY